LLDSDGRHVPPFARLVPVRQRGGREVVRGDADEARWPALTEGVGLEERDGVAALAPLEKTDLQGESKVGKGGERLIATQTAQP
jgi:hypothetical protein